VGVPGASFPVDRLAGELCEAGVVRAILASDADEAGDRFAGRATNALKAAGIDAERLRSPPRDAIWPTLQLPPTIQANGWQVLSPMLRLSSRRTAQKRGWPAQAATLVEPSPPESRRALKAVLAARGVEFPFIHS
jgi:hypothetical protein